MIGQFMRRHRVIVVDKSGQSSLDVSNLRCVFDLEKAISDDPNYGQVEIFNLAYETESNIINNGKKIVVEAGYENGAYGMIFSGEIIQPIRMKADETTTSLLLICQDGDTYLNQSFMATTLAKGASQREVIAAATAGGNIDVGCMADEIPDTKLARGKVMFGQSANYLKQVARQAQAQMYIEDGVINIVSATSYDTNTAVELNPHTGLVGTPEQTDDGVSFQCLINPRIKLNTSVYLNSTLIQAKQVDPSGETSAAAISSNGIYRVFKMSISGDTRGTDWYMSCEAIAQDGVKPVGLTGKSTNIWR